MISWYNCFLIVGVKKEKLVQLQANGDYDGDYNGDEKVADDDSDADEHESSGERSLLLWKPGQLRSPGTEMLQNHL